MQSEPPLLKCVATASQAQEHVVDITVTARQVDSMLFSHDRMFADDQRSAMLLHDDPSMMILGDKLLHAPLSRSRTSQYVAMGPFFSRVFDTPCFIL